MNAPLCQGSHLSFLMACQGGGHFPTRYWVAGIFCSMFSSKVFFILGDFMTLYFSPSTINSYTIVCIWQGGRETFLAYDRGTLSYHRKLIISTPATDVISGTSLISTELIIYKYMKNNGTDQTTVCGRVFVWMQYTLMILYTDLCRSASSTDPYD